jgi:NAD(P)-dependent dehydrogenase (short-subunit alcohol dehydrogenase family)
MPACSGPKDAFMQADSICALVTGGVSGLGLSVARRIVADGGKVALLDVNDAKGAEAIALLGAANACYLHTDVTDEADVASSVAAAHDVLGSMQPSTVPASSARAALGKDEHGKAARCRWPPSAPPCWSTWWAASTSPRPPPT